MGQLIRAIAFGLVCTFGGVVSAADPPDYLRDVKPILAERCAGCHGAVAQKGGLRLDTGALARKGADSGPVVDSASADESELLVRIRSTDDSVRMPPQGSPLSAEQVDVLKRWIEAGAPSPENEEPERDPRQHWSFIPPQRPAVPEAGSGWSLNPIDAFIAAAHSQRGVTPAGEADRTTLLRRVYFDLIGLPPTRAEIRTFLSDERADAYERVVDSLLARPQYGERWARHWMDVWRYSDWYGRRAVPDVMNSYPHIWRWRDWIVNSLNVDAGYDQMVQAMLAADEIWPGDDSQGVATGFLVRNWFKWNYEQWMKDNVEHTGKAFLGLTMNCAHCHDHKYDPITQEDYFRFRAFFEPLELRQDRVPGLPDPGPFIKYVYTQSYGPQPAGMVRVFDEKLDAETFMYALGDSRNRIPEKPAIPAATPEFFGAMPEPVSPIDLPPEVSYPALKSFIQQEELAKAKAAFDAAEETLKKAHELYAQAETALASVRQRSEQPVTAANPPAENELLNAERAVLDSRFTLRVDEQGVAVAASALQALTARIAAEESKHRGVGSAAELARAAFLAEKHAAFETAQHAALRAERAVVLARRSAAATFDDQAKAEAARADAAKAEQAFATARTAVDQARVAFETVDDKYTPLQSTYPTKSTGRRRALARWITHRSNPLAARVAMNHMWLRHFGQGLVPTPSDFGRHGQPPSHPELLDWLAVELMDNGWKMKHIHRLIVTSRVYRLQSRWTESDPQVKADRDNRWYWRANTRRLEAEAVRDAVLACSESLDGKLGGDPLPLTSSITEPRRSLYFESHGEKRMEFIDIFDGPNVCDCYKRSESVLPQQALALSNSDLTVKYSRILAGKLWTEASAAVSPEARISTFITTAFEQVLNRPPSASERVAALEFLIAQAAELRSVNPETLAASAAAGKDSAPSSDIEQRSRESLLHVLFNHNGFVTVR